MNGRGGRTLGPALVVALAVALLAAGCTGHPTRRAPEAAPEPAVATFRNPVFEQDAPDPTVTRGPDGAFYAYTTQSLYDGALVNLPVLRSVDLVHWAKVADAFPTRPRWVIGDFWAPHILVAGGVWYLYFAARQYGVGRMAIGVATARRPTGPFTDLGHPIVTGQRYHAIDPMAFAAADGKRYLYWGSDGAPIWGQQLAPDGRGVVGRRHPLLVPSDKLDYEDGLIEGAWMLRHGRFYYLMYSGGDCCSDHAHYAVGVARATSPLGPFTRFGGNPILAANDSAWATGHNATIRDSADQDWILYHARVRGDPSDLRYLFLDRITWTRDGWPQVNGGHGPSSTPQPAPRVLPP
jgi:arabinan endo-1,5-alpha-L-arabinosidase